jgi:hypothetical protein
MNTDGHRSEGVAKRTGVTQRRKDVFQRNLCSSVFICGLCSFHKIQPPDSGSACRAARGKPCAIRWRTKSDFDLLIAATARTDDLTPATLNIRDFRNQIEWPQENTKTTKKKLHKSLSMRSLRSFAAKIFLELRGYSLKWQDAKPERTLPVRHRPGDGGCAYGLLRIWVKDTI